MEDSTAKSKNYRIHKAKYTSQDFRAKVIEARDELQANVDFLVDIIRKDRYRLKHYEEQHGDLRYRPIVQQGNADGSIETKYGNPTELVLEPLASKYRATIKSLLDSIKLINTELLPEDNPEGEVSQTSSDSSDEATSKRQSLRDQFRSMSENPQAFKPAEPEASEDQEDFTNKVKQGLIDADQGRTKPTKEAKAITQSWRDTTPKATAKPKQSTVVKEPSENIEQKKAIDTEGPKGLSPMMRARLAGGGLSRMDALKKKYEDDGDDE
jgi:predicted transcriptional regulator